MKIRPQLNSATILVCLAAAGFAQPQGPFQSNQVLPSVRQGKMSTTPVGVLVGNEDLLIAGPGQGSAAPEEWSSTTFGAAGSDYPDFSMAEIFDSYAGVVKLASFSTGNDLMPPVSPTGIMNMAAGPIWFALSVSVTNASSGDAGSHIERAKENGTNTPGAELFTYYAAGSTGIHASLVNSTVSERSRQRIGLPDNDPVIENRPDVKGVDYGLGIIPYDPNQRSGMMFNVRDRFYFTLDPDCLASLDSEFAVEAYSQIPAANLSSTIYECRWDDSNGSFEWTQPQVYRTAQDLGIDEADTIDAIAVDFVNSRVIYSTQPVPGRDQLLVHQLGMTPGPLVPGGTPPPYITLRDENGLTFSSQLGLGTGSDVDGSCGIDPENVANFSGAVGIPKLGYTPLGTEPMGISLSRARAGLTGVDMMHLHITGTSSPGAVASTLYVFITPHSKALLGGPLLTPGNWTPLITKDIAAGVEDVSFEFPAVNLGYELGVAAYSVHHFPPDDRTTAASIRGSWVSSIEM